MGKKVHFKNDIHVFVKTGTVMGPTSTWSETHVSGGGGGGYVGPGGHISGGHVSVSSTVTERNRFFLKLANGKEAEINVHGDSFGVRDGHLVTTALCGHKADSTGWYIGFHNRNTDERLVSNGALNSIISSNDIVSYLMYVFAVIFISSFFPNAVLGLIAGLILGLFPAWVLEAIRKSALRGEIKRAVNAALDRAVAEQEAAVTGVPAVQQPAWLAGEAPEVASS